MTGSHGRIIILNGPPKSGKSSIAREIQRSFAGVWMNLGVDGFMQMTPKQFLPGIGLRPGGERPDLEPHIFQLYRAMYDSVAAHSRLGINVVMDVGHHGFYSTRHATLLDCVPRLHDLPVLLVGVRCPLDEIMRRRRSIGWNTDIPEGAPVPEAVRRWQEEAHDPGIYDIEVDTSVLGPEACARSIGERMNANEPSGAMARLISNRNDAR